MMRGPRSAAQVTVSVLAGVVLGVLGSETVNSQGASVRQAIPDLAGRPIVVQVTTGEVQVEAWAQPGVDVEISPVGRGARQADAIEAQVSDGQDVVTVRAVQPGNRRDPDVKVRVVLRVPATAVIQRIELFEGSLTLEGLKGSLQAKVERGPIVGKRLGGIVRLETVEGDLSVSEAELSTGGLLRLRTFNGNLVLGLRRAPADARVLVLTLNGSIRSDLALSERVGFGPRFREGVFGRGEPLISLDVVRGDITLSTENR